MHQKVLFLCTHNSARSQMAEALLQHFGSGRFEAHSAGVVATRVRAEAATVMRELGIDLSGHESKTLDRFLHGPFDLVVTVCDDAREACPTFSNAKERLHWSIPDPASIQGSEEERLTAFRSARLDLEGRIRAEIVEPATGTDDLVHYRKLERMYLSAPTNVYYRPRIAIGQGDARVEVDVRSEFFHAAGGVHGSVYFKVLDDACFFAANSLVNDVFVLTSQFNIQLVRPISEGRMIAAGCVLHSGRSSQIVRGELHDESRDLLAVGQGTFVKSGSRLTAELGYRLP